MHNFITYSETVELHRSDEAAATPETEGANLSERFVSSNKMRIFSLSIVRQAFLYISPLPEDSFTERAGTVLHSD